MLLLISLRGLVHVQRSLSARGTHAWQSDSAEKSFSRSDYTAAQMVLIMLMPML
jgi:hypothetical protein